MRALVLIIAVAWTVPTAGLLISSLRTEVAVSSTGWWTVFAHPFEFTQYTLANYERVLTAEGLFDAFVNSLIVTIPATVIPITLAAFAAYGFAWTKFRGRSFLFAMVVGLLVIPLQMSLVPLLRVYGNYRPGRDVRRRLAGPHRLRAAAGHLSPLQLHLPAAQGHLRVGLHRRGDTVHGLHPPGDPAVVPGPGFVRHLPVPLGVERPAGVAGLPRNQP